MNATIWYMLLFYLNYNITINYDLFVTITTYRYLFDFNNTNNYNK